MSKPQYVYFVADRRRRYVKIGVSNNPWWRVVDLQAGSPLTLQLEHTLEFSDRTAAFTYEDALHQKFAAHWRHGEWFNYAKPIKDFVAGWKRGEHQTVYQPRTTAKAYVGEYGACLSKAEFMALMRDEARAA